MKNAGLFTDERKIYSLTEISGNFGGFEFRTNDEELRRRAQEYIEVLVQLINNNREIKKGIIK